MPRRRHVVSSSSDEEDDYQPSYEQLENAIQLKEPAETVQPVTMSPPNPNPNPDEPVPISDDEFIDVSDNLSPPSPPSAPSVSPPSAPSVSPPLAPSVTSATSVESIGSPIGDFLLRLGLKLKREWLESCLEALERSVPGFPRFETEAKAKLCFQQFLFSDMNYSGGGVLPANVDSMHLVDLEGPFVLQVDEIVNISSPLRGRYQEAPSGIKRCLKLSMTDGLQRVFGMEYRPIKDLKVFSPAGLKVAICKVHIRHGLLMLVPEALEVLGGMVEELEAARQRLVNEVNKPPRGKRTRTGVAPPLATRATRAAWPSIGVSIPDRPNSSQNLTSLQENEQGDTFGAFGTGTSQRTMEDSTVSRRQSIAPNPNPSHSVVPGAEAMHVDTIPNSTANTDIMEESTVSSRQSTMPIPNPSSNVVPEAEVMHIDTVPISTANIDIIEESTISSRQSTLPNANPSSDVVSGDEEMHVDTIPTRVANAESNLESDAVSTAEDIHMVEHPLILSGAREVPFTYLASLSVKWAGLKEKRPSVQGKIKCFLTGVKKFQYKQRVYELWVYIDDGSLISEILIDHDVVQKGIGHSPQEVTAALSSSDKRIVNDMKQTMRQYQSFLVNFEGTMLVEMNKSSPFPIALEMRQGCPASDAWLLLRRLKSSAPVQTPSSSCQDPIDLSP